MYIGELLIYNKYLEIEIVKSFYALCQKEEAFNFSDEKKITINSNVIGSF